MDKKDVKQVIREYLMAQELAYPDQAGRLTVDFDGGYYVICGIGAPKFWAESRICGTTYSFLLRAAERIRTEVENE